jgi:Ca-activated chloride channel family protein
MPFKEDTCRDIARIGGGTFFRAIDTKTMQDIFFQIDQLEKTETSVQTYQTYQDLFALALGTGLVLLTINFIFRETVWSRLP